MKQLERMMFRPALRLSRRKIVTPKGLEVWSNYALSRGLECPSQKLPKVGHFSRSKAIRGE